MPEDEPVDTITTAIDFLNRIRSEKEVTIKFIKKDGSVRIMRCTLDFMRIPRSSQPKGVNLAKIMHLVYNKKILHVFDLDIGEWRSVPFNRAEWVETSEKMYKIVHPNHAYRYT